jgi:hypothetical protein
MLSSAVERSRCSARDVLHRSASSGSRCFTLHRSQCSALDGSLSRVGAAFRGGCGGLAVVGLGRIDRALTGACVGEV